MSFLLTSILTGIGLSMDAFSLAIIYGTLNVSKKKILLTTSTVGIYHFFMPIFGYLLGDLFLSEIISNKEFLVGAILLIIAVEMLLSFKKDETPTMLTNFVAILLFGFTVSIDSFSVGIGFGTMQENLLLPAIVYALTSALFTYLGLTLGKKLSNKFGRFATLLGSIILILMSLNYFFF